MDRAPQWGLDWHPQYLRPEDGVRPQPHEPRRGSICASLPSTWNPRDWVPAPALSLTHSVASGRTSTPRGLTASSVGFSEHCSQNKCLSRVPQKQSLRQGFCAVGCCGRPPAEGGSSAGWRSWLETALPDPARRPGPALRQGSTFCLLALASRWLWAVPAGKRGGRGWFPGEGAAVSISSQRRPQLGAGSTGWERGPETHPPPAQHGTRVTGRAHRSSPDRGFTKAKTSVIS